MRTFLLIAVIGVLSVALLFGWRKIRARLRRRNARVKRAYRRVMRSDLDPQKLERLVGASGICRAACRPQGRVEIGGTEYDAKAEAFIPAGSRVVVTDLEIRTISTFFNAPLLTVRKSETEP